MLVPQRPYFPVATLAAAITYPGKIGTFDDARLADALTAVGLPGMVTRLHEEAHWNRMLSLGEQQRLAIARALLQAPDYLFLDEATASLDEPAEAMLYRLLQDRLKGTTIISIGHRSTLGAFHRRRVDGPRSVALSGARRAAGSGGRVTRPVRKPVPDDLARPQNEAGGSVSATARHCEDISGRLFQRVDRCRDRQLGDVSRAAPVGCRGRPG